MSELNRELNDLEWSRAFVALMYRDIRIDIAAQINPLDTTNRKSEITLRIYERELLERLNDNKEEI